MGSIQELEVRVTTAEGSIAGLSEESILHRAALGLLEQSVESVRSTQHKILVVLEALAKTQEKHYAEHKADAAALRIELAGIVRLLEGQGRGSAKTES